MSKRIALIVDNHVYQDKTLSQLKTPPADPHRLAAALSESIIGDFDSVETLVNQPTPEICSHIRDFFNWKKRYDLLLLYISGHIILDPSGRLFVATSDTRLDALADSAIPAAYITECMDRSFSRQQILILDCYPAGIATPEGEHVLDSSVDIATAFQGRGYGRVVLTATDTIQYILGRKTFGAGKESVFTQYLAEALRTGAADADADGQIEIRELYEYILDQVVRNAPAATHKPRLWSYGKRDKFIIARNPNYLQQKHSIKWDIIFGAIMAPLATIVIGSAASVSTSVGMAGLFLLLYAGLYWILD